MIVERIVEYLKHKNIAVSAFEREMGFANTTISRAYKNGGAIGSDKIEKIVAACDDLSPTWLLTGEGEMLKEAGHIIEAENKEALPLIPREALAHSGTPIYRPDEVEYYYNVRELNRRSDFLVRAKGDYMLPKYNGGDLIACRYVKNILYFQWGRIYFISTKSQGEFIRRIQPAEEPEYIKCCCDNTKYAPFDIPKSDIISLAIVKGSVSFE